MAAKKPETAEPDPVTPDETPIEAATAEPEPIEAPRDAIVRCLIHLDDGADTGRYYRPGDVIEGWTDERIAAMVGANIAEIV